MFVLRDVEEMSTTEAAEALGVSEDNVKTRLHRAHAMLRKHLYVQAGLSAANVLPFHAPRCDRVVKAVLAKIDFFSMWQTALSGQLPVTNVLVYLSIAVFGLFLTVKVLEARKWS